MNRIRNIAILAVVLSIFVVNVASAELVNFKMADGVSVKGEVISVSLDQITVNKWLTAGGYEKKEIVIKWDNIAPEYRDQLMRKFGIPLKEERQSRFLRDGLKIKKGNSVITGIPDEESSSDISLVLYTERGRYRITREKIDSTEPVKLDARKYLPPRKIYENHVKDNPPVSARDHFKLALYCEEIGALKLAIDHYKHAVETDDRYGHVLTDNGGKIANLESKYREDFAMDLFKRAVEAFEEKDYRDAANAISRILENYGDTDAASRARNLEEKVKENLELEIAEEVVDDYYKLIERMIRKRVSGKVLDGPSEPGFKVDTTRGTVEGVLVDENGNPVPPPSSDEMDFGDDGDDEDFEEEFDYTAEYIYVKNRRGEIIEIPRNIIEKMEPVELNDNLKEPEFVADHLPFLQGRDSQLDREIRSKLAFEYGISESEIKEMWENRSIVRKTIDGKILRRSLARTMMISYGRGTWFSPKLKRQVTFKGRKGLVPRYPLMGVNDDEYFESLSHTDKINTLKGIYAEYSLEIDEDSVRVNTCPVCKGTGKSKKTKEIKRGNVKINRPMACEACHGLGAYLSFRAQ